MAPSEPQAKVSRDWSGRYLQNTTGTWEMVDDDGFIVDLPDIYQLPDFGMHDIQTEPLPQRTPLTGPPLPLERQPAELIERFADAVREWAQES
ncbi:hypothetical protein ACW2Q0_00430 [Nocardia sp. R16R-3T]